MKEWIRGLSNGVLIFIGTLVALLVIGLVGVYGFGWFQRSTANFRGQTSAIEKTRANANFRIAAYNVFFDDCNGIKAIEAKIAIAEDAVEQFKGTDQHTTAIANLNALRSNRENLIADYNNKASRDFTEGQFRDSKLPYRIDSDQEKTVCD